MRKVGAGPLLVALMSTLLAGCGGRATSAVATTVTEQTSRGCVQVSQREALARAIPRLSYDLRNQDVANFTGTGAQCNQRQLVYWGPSPALPGSDRQMVFVQLTFRPSTVTVDDVDLGPGAAVIVRNGGRFRTVSSTGASAVRWVSGRTVVTVIAACVNRKTPTDLAPVPCRKPAPSDAAVKARAMRAALALRPPLDRELAQG